MPLQNPVKVKGTPAIGRKSTYPSPLVMLDILVSAVLGVIFHARPSKSTLKSRQTILPCHDGAFPTIQFPLLGKEILLQLNGHSRCSHRI
jgi:hypothetical protein